MNNQASNGRTALLELRDASKYFGNIIALKDINIRIRGGEVMCLLGDNGAGKSTLIKIFAGVHQQSEGDFFVEGDKVLFNTPRDALDCGIATVYQDLAMIPLMSISRNFFLGSEPKRSWGPFKRFDHGFANRTVREELMKMGIDIRDPDQAVGTMSGGERQSVAIARAVYFGAKVLILDEPTAALGVKQAGTVLRYIAQARARGLGVIFITHNPHHAYPVGDKFTILKRGRQLGTWTKAELTREEMISMMSGGAELEELGHELETMSQSGEVDGSALRELAAEVEEEAEELLEDAQESREAPG
jgi:simple sugar transport system ATP-binding protein